MAKHLCTRSCVPRNMGCLKEDTVYDFPNGIPKGMEQYFEATSGEEKAIVAKPMKAIPPKEVPKGAKEAKT